jgi:hypothetical protein
MLDACTLKLHGSLLPTRRAVEFLGDAVHIKKDSEVEQVVRLPEDDGRW